MDNTPKNISIIGCNGYIGRHLCAFFKNMGWNISGYDIGESSFVPINEYVRLNLKNQIEIEKLNVNVDFIFYFSGITGTARAYEEYEQYIDVNIKGLSHVLDVIRRKGSKARLIFPSTRLIYKGAKDEELNEDSEKEFKTIYALNKWFGEQLIQQYSNYFGLKYTIFRICIPYGNLFTGEYSYGTVGFFLKKARGNEHINLFGNGEQKRTFTHIEDLCNQLFLAIINDRSENEIYNVAGHVYSLREIADLVAHKFHVGVNCQEWPEIDKRMESGDTVFDSSKIRNLAHTPLNWTFEKWMNEL